MNSTTSDQDVLVIKRLKAMSMWNVPGFSRYRSAAQWFFKSTVWLRPWFPFVHTPVSCFAFVFLGLGFRNTHGLHPVLSWMPHNTIKSNLQLTDQSYFTFYIDSITFLRKPTHKGNCYVFLRQEIWKIFKKISGVREQWNICDRAAMGWAGSWVVSWFNCCLLCLNALVI